MVPIKVQFLLKITAKEEAMARAEQYKSLLKINGEQLPDPFVDIRESEWMKKTGMTKWPPIFQSQIAEFILSIDQGKDLGKRLLRLNHKFSLQPLDRDVLDDYL